MERRHSKRQKKNTIPTILLSSDTEDEKKNAKKKTKVQPRKKKNKKIWEMTAAELKEMWKTEEEARKNDKQLIEEANETQKKLLENIEKEKEYERLEKEKAEQEKNFIIKDCKHLSNEKLTEMFTRDLQWIDDIFKGRIYCERHELFKKQHHKYRLTSKDLNYNVSCEVFNQDQLIHLVGLFRSKYDNGNIFKHNDYYWKVLLPEYCLKIFMECYNFERDAALDYLNIIPVSFGSNFKV